MMGDEPQVGQFVQQAREHHARHRHAAFEGPAKHLPDLVLRLVFAGIVGAAGRARRVHPHRQLVLPGDALEHGEEIRVVERAGIHVGQHLDAARPELFHRPIHFLQRGGRIVHRQRGHEGRELVRPLAAHLGHAVVGHPREPGRHVGAAKQFRRGHGQRQHLLHLRPLVQHGHTGLDVPQHAQVAHALDHAGLLAVLLDKFQVGQRHDVVVDVDLGGLHCLSLVVVPPRACRSRPQRPIVNVAAPALVFC